MPHGHCYFWKPEILWLHVVSDGLITLSYFSIPIAMAFFIVKRKDLAKFKYIFFLFCAFILFCGYTHLIEIYVVWNPIYGISGIVKAVTAFFSIATAVMVWLVIPVALGLPSPAMLQKSNKELQVEILERKKIESKLVENQHSLEEVIEEVKLTHKELEKREKEAVENNKFIESITNVVPDTIYVYDLEEEKIVYKNQNFSVLLGQFTQEDDMLQKSFLTSVIDAQDIKGFQEYHDKIRKDTDNQSYKISYRLKRKDGQKKWVQSYDRPFLRNESDGVKQIVGIIRDITEKKEIEESKENLLEELIISQDNLKKNSKRLEQTNNSLVKVKQELEEIIKRESEQKNKLDQAYKQLKNTQGKIIQSEKMASIGQLTAGIAHEINNPINFINSGVDALEVSMAAFLRVIKQYDLLEHLEEKEDFKSKVKELKKMKALLEWEEIQQDTTVMIQEMKIGAERVSEIIRSLHNFSRIDEAEYKPADIHEGILTTLLLLKNQTKNGIRITTDFDESINRIYCYPGKLNQVFMNLLINAIQAIEQTGEIKIKTLNLGDHVSISIRDTGIGIPKKLMNNIFDPFFTTKKVGEGTGLGLSISYEIIKQHHGTIQVLSEEGGGSEFIISLPLQK